MANLVSCSIPISRVRLGGLGKAAVFLGCWIKRGAGLKDRNTQEMIGVRKRASEVQLLEVCRSCPYSQTLKVMFGMFGTIQQSRSATE